jgi:hypothetical protein
VSDDARALALFGDFLGAAAGEGGWHCLEVQGRIRPWWLRSPRARLELPLFEDALWDGEPIVNVVPCVEQGRFLLRRPVGMLWARTDSRDSARRLRAFRPAPAIVLREGATIRYTAFWLLDGLLTHDELERFNRRLAHRLRTPKKWCGVEFRVPLPGTFLRSGRSRPVHVRMPRCVPAVHSWEEIVGKLRDAPDPDAWREASLPAGARPYWLA